MQSPNEDLRELTLLENIENDPNVNQSTLATQLGVAVGTVNWHLKRLIAKGYVKVKRAERKKLRYIITPEGIALRARLAVLPRCAAVPGDHHPTQLDAGIDRGEIRRVQADPAHVVGPRAGRKTPGGLGGQRL